MQILSILFYTVVAMCIVARMFHIVDLRNRYHEMCILRSQRRDYNTHYNRDVYFSEMSPYMVWISVEETFLLLLAVFGIMTSQCVFFAAIILIDLIPSSRKVWVYTRTIASQLLMIAALANRMFHFVQLPCF